MVVATKQIEAESDRIGRAELREFDDAPLLMDGRRKNRQGQDGAMQVNAHLLREHSRRTGQPIAAISCARQ